MSNFISAFIEHTKEYESPTSFWKWAAYATVSAVLRDSCYRKQGDFSLYPSQFILFLARSSYDRKNPPVSMSERLVDEVANTKIISGRASIQGILDELSRAETNRKTGKIVKGGSAILYAPELSAALVEDPAAIKVLTDIYDFKANPFRQILRTQPRFQIDKLVFSMLGASNVDMIKDIYNSTAIQGGLLARTMLIVPNEFRQGNTLFDMPDKTAGFECLVKLLRELTELKGEYQITDSGKRAYESWYLPFRMDQKKKTERTGILGRIHTHILKLAMVLAANDFSLTMNKHHIEEAITECLSLIPNYTLFAMSSGKSDITEAGETILAELYDAPNFTMSQRTLLSRNWSRFDLQLLDRVTLTFEAGGLITRLIEGNEVSFRLTPKCLEILRGKGAES